MSLCLCGDSSIRLRHNYSSAVIHSGATSIGDDKGKQYGDVDAHTSPESHRDVHTGAAHGDQHALYDTDSHPGCAPGPG